MVQKRFEGFLNTPCLWHDDAVLDLRQFEITPQSDKVDIILDEKLRLGKYVERLVSFQIAQYDNMSILAENVQIQEHKTTLGELDCVLLRDNKPIHLEIIYKFYLYDPSVGITEIDHFIGPNRKDSLIEKLTKLKEKQLPLLYSDACRKYLNAIDLKVEDIEQQVYFKAQLFVPFSNREVQLKKLNSDCIVGFYVNPNELNQFADCKFYLPIKKDCLIEPHMNVNWLNFKAFNDAVKDYFKQQFSTLCWVKFNSSELKKLFLVWW